MHAVDTRTLKCRQTAMSLISVFGRGQESVGKGWRGNLSCSGPVHICGCDEL